MDRPPQSGNVVAAKAGSRPATALDAAAARGRMPRRLRNIFSLEDLEAAGRSYLPRPLFSYVADGAERQASVKNNRLAFEEWSLLPRVLRDTSARDQSVALFDRVRDAPFGICPMGGAALIGFEADLVLARAAAAANIPMILSAASLIAMEAVRQTGADVWYQAYVTGEREALAALMDRIERAGFETLVITVDVPVIANRENYLRNGFSLPLRPTARLAFEGLVHPGWLVGTLLRTLLTSGMPHMENMTATRGAPALARAGPRHLGRRDALNWTDIEWVRARWKGRLVIKGILAPADAALARQAGVDGIIVSNHGGRQLDGATASLRALPAVVAEAGGMTVMFDSGIRRGTDVLKALALGATIVFVGRPFLFATAIGGAAGILHAISLLSQEIDCDLALLGARSMADVGRDMLILNGQTAGGAEKAV